MHVFIQLIIKYNFPMLTRSGNGITFFKLVYSKSYNITASWDSLVYDVSATFHHKMLLCPSLP